VVSKCFLVTHYSGHFPLGNGKKNFAAGSAGQLNSPPAHSKQESPAVASKPRDAPQLFVSV